MSPSGQTPPKGTQDIPGTSHWAPTQELSQPKGTTWCSVAEECASRELHRYLLKNGFPSNLEERERAGIKPQACNWDRAGREGSWLQCPPLTNPWPPHILSVQQRGDCSPFSMGMGRMNASDTTKRFFACGISRDHLRILDGSLESCDVGWISPPAPLFPCLSLPPPVPATLTSCRCRTWHRRCQEQRASERSCPSGASPSSPARLPASFPLIYVSPQCYLSTAP